MLVEYWHWRYRNPATGRFVTTSKRMTADEVAIYPEATRVRGSLRLREVETDFADTMPRVFRPKEKT